ncbi:MAG: PH domain-containing protein [Patescibacteria group bacterium]
MSLLQNLLGNATEADASQYESIVNPVLVEGENVQYAYKLLRDLIIFTNERLIMVNVQGLTGKKKEISSIPYSSVSVFTMENAGTMDFDSEIKLHVKGLSVPVSLKFGKNSDITGVYKILSEKILPVT